ncbi:MAG: HIT family protein [Saprospiraceae bacterium]|nr:HIT family protein [Saprospiraceae bacterium]MDP4699155.1 HIT family protein [Saprospiraceae bacterium]MDP4815132.1 HIT family protein [Saprospiraceae bacterium]
MPSIFSRIINGEIPAWKVAESEHFLAFLDVNPLAKGHTLIVPKVETDYFFDLSDEEISGIMLFSKKVASALRSTLPCLRIGMSVIGLEVPHAHVHLVPLNSMGDINFSNSRLNFSAEEMEAIAASIRSAYDKL